MQQHAVDTGRRHFVKSVSKKWSLFTHEECSTMSPEISFARAHEQQIRHNQHQKAFLVLALGW